MFSFFKFDFQYNPVSITPGNLRTMPSESSDLEPYAHNSVRFD